MQIRKLSMMLMAFSLAAILNGCGASSKEAGILPSDVPRVSEASCRVCHATSIDPITNTSILTDYLASPHALNETEAGCQGCHGGGSQHNGVGPIPYPNPDTAGRCWNCHRPAFLGAYGTPSAAEVAHFQNITSYRVQYINPTSADKTTCGGCHAAHNPLTGNGADERAAWAASAHGDVTSSAWLPSSTHKWLITGASTDFSQAIPASDCLRCHTADGFVQFTKSDYTSIANLPGDPKVNSALKCDACHNDASFSVRSTGAVATAYNATATAASSGTVVATDRIAVTYPDVAQSNLCVSCHSGRTSGPNITDLFNSGKVDFSNTGFQNSHYMAAAGTMYMTAGFKNFTTLTALVPTSKEGAALTFGTKTYAQTLTAAATGKGGVGTAIGIAGGQTSSHRALGTPSIDGSEPYLTAAGPGHIDTNGPCVTCHMKAYNPAPSTGGGVTFTPPAAGRSAHGHSLLIDDAAGQELCLECHNDAPNLKGGDGAGNAVYVQYHTFADLVSTQLEGQSAAFQNGLTLIKEILLNVYKIKFDDTAYPYFYDTVTNKSVTDWTRKSVAGVTDVTATAMGITPVPTGGLTQAQAYRLMGACFNMNLLAREPGAYVHARTYSQRLVYDTVDFLDNRTMDFSALTTARAVTAYVPNTDPLFGVYVGNNVNVFASDGSLVTESMAWLAGTHYNDGSSGNTLVPLNRRP